MSLATANHDSGTSTPPEIVLLSYEDVADIAFVAALPLVANLAAGRPYDAFQSRALQSDSWVRVPEHYAAPGLFVVRVNGESMEPTLSDGDLVICEWHRTPRQNGQVVIMAHFEAGGEGGECALKRFEDSETHWLFHSDNPEVPDPPAVPKLDQPSYPILGPEGAFRCADRSFSVQEAQVLYCRGCPDQGQTGPLCEA